MIVKLACGTVFHCVCQVWFSSCSPELFTFSYCAWLWNWLVEQSSIVSVKFDFPVARQNFSLLATAHDFETGLFDHPVSYQASALPTPGHASPFRQRRGLFVAIFSIILTNFTISFSVLKNTLVFTNICSVSCFCFMAHIQRNLLVIILFCQNHLDISVWSFHCFVCLLLQFADMWINTTTVLSGRPRATALPAVVGMITWKAGVRRAFCANRVSECEG